MEASLKERAHQLLDELSEDATFEDRMDQLYELRAVELGLADGKAGRLTPHDDAQAQVMARLRKSA